VAVCAWGSHAYFITFRDERIVAGEGVESPRGAEREDWHHELSRSTIRWPVVNSVTAYHTRDSNCSVEHATCSKPSSKDAPIDRCTQPPQSMAY
jgi:hypothetical protein